MDMNLRLNSMEDLLNIYKDADMFSLTGPFYYMHPIGTYKLSQEQGSKILKDIKEHLMKRHRNIYNDFNDTVKKDLPPFEELHQNIDEECRQFEDKVDKGKLLEGESPFIADHFKIDTLYKNPTELWQFYNGIGMYYHNFQKTVQRLMLNKKERSEDLVFRNSDLSVIKESLIKQEITFHWHCTISSKLSIVYYFKFNENTKSWLRQFKSDFDIRPLVDLAFYKNNKLLFSSCTHEGYHYDLRKKQIKSNCY